MQSGRKQSGRNPRDPSTTTRARWLARGGVLLALSLTLWFFGPRAYEVLAARVHLPGSLANSPAVEVERAGLIDMPTWLPAPMLEACLQDLAPRLVGRVAIMDEAAALRTRDALAASPYVASARIERIFPDRFRARLSLRKPELEVHPVRAVDHPESEPIGYLDRHGVLLPGSGRIGLPRVATVQRFSPVDVGKVVTDARLRAAVAVAVEWRERVLPLCPSNTPALREVDASNLEYRMLGDQRFSEVQLGFERAEGGLAWLAYTHPPGSRWPRVEPEVLAEVLGALLTEHPGLAQVERADLRFQKRWRERVALAR